VDFVTELPPSGPEGMTNIMVITDRLFKTVIFEPMKTITTGDVAEKLIQCFIRYYGPPKAIVSDRGPQFVSLMWKRIC
jgi:Integrase core domain.